MTKHRCRLWRGGSQAELKVQLKNATQRIKNYTMHLVNQSKHPCQKIAELEAKIPEQENLQDVMRWALSDPSGFLPQVVADVIIQDEFTHDVIVPCRDEVVLVYDTT